MKWKTYAVLGVCLVFAFLSVWMYRDQLYATKFVEGPFAHSADVIGKIDSIEETENCIAITGWCIREGRQQEGYNWILGSFHGVYIHNAIVLQDDQEHVIQLHTLSVSRPDVNAAIHDGIQYGSCGVYAKVKSSFLRKGIVYRIGVLMTDQAGRKTLFISGREVRR